MLFDPVLGHLVGDFICQTDWQAKGKKQSSVICATHALIWTLCVLTFGGPVWWTWPVAGVLFVTHFVQDRGTLIQTWMHAIGQKDFATGPLSPWSIIIVDNVWHLIVLWAVSHFMLHQ